MSKADFITLAQMADDCLKANAYIESRAALTLIKRIAEAAAQRGQRKRNAAPHTLKEE